MPWAADVVAFHLHKSLLQSGSWAPGPCCAGSQGPWDPQGWVALSLLGTRGPYRGPQESHPEPAAGGLFNSGFCKKEQRSPLPPSPRLPQTQGCGRGGERGGQAPPRASGRPASGQRQRRRRSGADWEQATGVRWRVSACACSGGGPTNLHLLSISCARRRKCE